MREEQKGNSAGVLAEMKVLRQGDLEGRAVFLFLSFSHTLTRRQHPPCDLRN